MNDLNNCTGTDHAQYWVGPKGIKVSEQDYHRYTRLSENCSNAEASGSSQAKADTRSALGTFMKELQKSTKSSERQTSGSSGESAKTGRN
jgi:hypothetical protein